MKKFKVLEKFIDIYTREPYVTGKTYEVTKERFTEIQKNLTKYNGEFVQEVKVKAKRKKEEPSEEEGE